MAAAKVTAAKRHWTLSTCQLHHPHLICHTRLCRAPLVPCRAQRPIKDLTDALIECGCTIEHTEAPTSLPLKVHSTGLKGGKIELSGKVSSQFVSSVLLSAPYAQSPVEIVLKERPVSQSYIDMTVSLMAQFGIVVKREGDLVYKVPKGCYTNPKELMVECDASSATYPLAFAAITGGTVTCEAVGSASIQGDAGFAALCKRMGCTVAQDKKKSTVTGPKGKAGRLKAIDVDMEPMTDAFMTAVALAAVADGTTRITGIANQRVKECNRIEVMVTELGKLGITAGEVCAPQRPSLIAPTQPHLCFPCRTTSPLLSSSPRLLSSPLISSSPRLLSSSPPLLSSPLLLSTPLSARGWHLDQRRRPRDVYAHPHRHRLPQRPPHRNVLCGARRSHRRGDHRPKIVRR